MALWIRSVVVPVVCLVAVLIAFAVSHLGPAGPSGVLAHGNASGLTPSSSAVHTVIDLHNHELHPRQLVYDASRGGLWFWTSTQYEGQTYSNRIDFYSVASQQLQSWPLYEGDWSSQLHAGLALAPDHTVWIGWNHNLVHFDPGSGTWTRFLLSAEPIYPLPANIIGDLPADLGISDLAVARDGTVWIARYAAVSLTAFSPASQQFHEYPLPVQSGDPAKLAISPDDHILFTVNLSVAHPGWSADQLGEYAPKSGATLLYAQPAMAMAVTSTGDVYTTGGNGFGLSLLTASERAKAWGQAGPATFRQATVPALVDERSLAVGANGQLWLSSLQSPQILRLNPANGATDAYDYSALLAGADDRQPFPGAGAPAAPAVTPSSNQPAVIMSHIVAMATDGGARLWYIRDGNDQIEEVDA